MSYFECFNVPLMSQCNLSKSDEATFFVINLDWVFAQNWVLRYLSENAKTQLSSPSCYNYAYS